MSGAAPAERAGSRSRAVQVFLAFAFAYFFSALVRAVTATLAPVFSMELGLGAGQLGLLAGAYFLGFSMMQLPLGSALDRWGAQRVLLAFLSVAVLGCAAFAAASSFAQLLVARVAIGAGLSACLMAPLTCFRRLYSPPTQLRANAWMLMTGSLGMLASTLPVQWLLPVLGWRGLFTCVAGALVVGMLLVWRLVPVAEQALGEGHSGEALERLTPVSSALGYASVFAHPAFRRLAPLGFVLYGGLLAMQSLWIGPWLTQVAGYDAAGSAGGLFLVNLAMLFAFLGWGALMPRLLAWGWSGERLLAWTWPLSAVGLCAILAMGGAAGPVSWAAWCVCTSVVSVSQPAIGQAFPARLAGRALSAFNLMIFGGVFVLQWGIGLLIDLLHKLGWRLLGAHQGAFAAFLVLLVLAGLWLNVQRRRDRRAGLLGPRG